MRIPVLLLTVCLLATGCGGGDEAEHETTKVRRKASAAAEAPTGVPAVETKRIDLAACFADNLADEAAISSRCPSFALLALDYMGQTCTAVGGYLKPLSPPMAWSLDVDGDASAEILIDLTENIECEGAPGVFSCGSSGCPFLLHKKRGDAWIELGAFNADDAPGIEVMPAEEGAYATLRGGCTGLRPCSELVHYEWKGERYERTWIDFKGHPVDVVPGGLMTLTQDTAVIDAPGRKGQVADEYPVGTVVVVIGAARGEPYTFVSPCNACRRGFVETALLARR